MYLRPRDGVARRASVVKDSSRRLIPACRPFQQRASVVETVKQTVVVIIAAAFRATLHREVSRDGTPNYSTGSGDNLLKTDAVIHTLILPIVWDRGVAGFGVKGDGLGLFEAGLEYAAFVGKLGGP